MEYNPPKLFYKVKAHPKSELFKDYESPFYNYIPIYINIYYKTDSGNEGKVLLNKLGKKQNQLDWYGNNLALIISDDLFEKYFDKEKYYSEPTDFLAHLNLDEYNKLLELIDEYSTDLSKPLKGDSVAIKSLKKKVDSLLAFKSEFIDWFIERKIDFPIAEPTESFDDALSLSPYDLEDLNLNIEGQIKHLVMIARMDKREGIQEKWKTKILKTFKRNSPLGVIKRIMVKFQKEFPKEKFNINGMSWYKKSK